MRQESFTIYVVDDDVSIQRALKRLLTSFGYHALTFDSAEDFLEYHSLSSGAGLLVLDIRLPGMTGLELQKKLASLRVNCPIIFMTAHDNTQWRERAKSAGAVAYLKKPFHEQSLIDAIRLAATLRR